MKRLLVLAVISCIALAGTVSAKEKSLFSVYLDEKSPENFVKAFEAYEAQREDSLDFNATIVLSYLHLIELEKNLELLKENVDGLKNKNMFQYANILLELGRYDDSIEIYKVLNEKMPKWSCPWRHRGEAHWKKGELGLAVMSLEKAIETRETHYDAYVMLAEVLRDMGRFEEALETLEKGITYYGKDIEDPEEEVNTLDRHFLHLDLLVKCGETERYKEQLEMIKKIAPEDERLKDYPF
jgi:tetratricopeptide (TPR) repeat protein